jgi:hypothetical protein
MATLADILRQTGYAQGGTLATPTPTASPMTKVLTDHIASIPQKFNENQAHQMDLLARAYPGNTFKSNMLEGDPKALAELAMQVPIIGMTAYHGTPHKIKGLFDINKVGTGEGAQAYGHGMYFAENPAVATEYKNMLGSKIDVNGKPLYNANKTIGSTGNTELDDYLVANLGDVKATRKQLLNDIKEIRPTNPVAAKEMQITLADLRKANVGVQNTGNLYKVDIPDEQIPNMLDWDKPFSKQTPQVQEALKKMGSEIKFGSNKDSVADFVKLTGNLPPYFQRETGHGIYSELSKQLGGDKQASEYLNSLGIKGTRYLDQQSRGKSGTSNFVTFDPSTVKILEENAKPVSRKALIEEQVKKLKD